MARDWEVQLLPWLVDAVLQVGRGGHKQGPFHAKGRSTWSPGVGLALSEGYVQHQHARIDASPDASEPGPVVFEPPGHVSHERMHLLLLLLHRRSRAPQAPGWPAKQQS